MAFPNSFPAPFVVNPKLTAITVAYQNGKFIADDVLPRVGVDTPSFLYSIFNKGDMFTVPDTKVGRTSEVNQVDWNATQGTASVEDHALDEIVPRRDQVIASSYGSPIDPKAIATEQVSNLLALGREQRAANLVFNPATYAAANTTTLTSTAQWSDFTNSDPLTAILNAMDGMLVKPNQFVIGELVATKLRTHPKILQAWHGNNGAYGNVPLSFLAELIGVDEVLVGQSYANSVAKGQTPALNRLWGKHAALLYKAPVSVSESAPTFAITAQWGIRITGEYFDFKKGMRGSDIVRVGESVKEVVLANDLGYFFQNAIA
jgi:hypothetical protein